jgi:DNA-binding response OmpR family regulator
MPNQHVLIVEDQREVSRLLRSTFETLGAGIEVVEIPSGEEAMLYSSRNQVDLMVADYRLPGISGVELLHKVRKYQPNAKIILVTGQSAPAIRKEVAEAGADAFFFKPVPMDEFLEAVEHNLGWAGPSLTTSREETENQELPSIPGLLAGLRQELSATVVLLLEDSGQILARAGDLPGIEIENTILTPLLSILSTGQKISRLIGQRDGSPRFSIEGGMQDLILLPVGAKHSLLIIGSELTGREQAARHTDAIQDACRDLEEVFDQPAPGVPASQEPATTPLEVTERTMKEMAPLFKDAKKKLKHAEVDEFWKKAADQNQPLPSPDMLSYDQAKQLGLAPEDES